MTVTSTAARRTHEGNGSATVFSFDFPITAAADLVATLTDAAGTETTLAEGSDYAVSVAAYPGSGSVTCPLSGPPLPPGVRLTLRRELVIDQQTDLQNQGNFYAETHEAFFDKAIMICQQLADAIGRAAKLPASTALSSLALPSPIAGRLLGWNGAGDGLENYAPNSGDFVSEPARVLIESLQDALAANPFAVPRVNAAGNALELRTPLQLRGDIGAAAALFGVPVGTVADFAGSAAPAGWLLCHGQSVSRTAHAALFAVLGTTYGPGDGSTTFGLPDLRGRVVAGKDDMGGTAAGRLTGGLAGGIDGDTLGAAGGEQAHVLTQAELASHTHGVVDPGHGHAIETNDPSGGAGMWPFTGGARAGSPSVGSSSSSHSVTSISVGAVGENQAHNSVQPTLILNKVIFAGI